MLRSGFKCLEKVSDSLGGQVADFQPGQPASALFGYKVEKQSDGITIAADRSRTEPLLRLQKIFKEGIQEVFPVFVYSCSNLLEYGGCKALETLVGFRQQVRRHGQIHRRRCRIDMAEQNGQVHQAGWGINSATIPFQQY